MLDSNKALADFLDETKIPVRLAALNSSGWPMVMSLWFIRRDGALWCATQDSAKIVTYLKTDPRCGYEVAPDQPPYRGVRGRGRAAVHEDKGKEILEVLLDRYLGGQDSPLAGRLLSKSVTEVAIEIKPRSAHTWDFRERMEGSIQTGGGMSPPSGRPETISPRYGLARI